MAVIQELVWMVDWCQFKMFEGPVLANGISMVIQIRNFTKMDLDIKWSRGGLVRGMDSMQLDFIKEFDFEKIRM